MSKQINQYNQTHNSMMDISERAVEYSTRLIFKELKRIEIDRKIEDSQRYLSPFTFWQYSKLPKPLSDKVFKFFESTPNRWPYSDFFQAISTLKNWFTSEMAQNRKFINSPELYRFFNICLEPHLGGLIQQEEIQENFKFYNETQQSPRFQSQDQFQISSCHKYSVLSFLKLMKQLISNTDIFITPSTISKVMDPSQGDSNISIEGTLLRSIEGGNKSLKPYYYRLKKSFLFVYRNKEEINEKYSIYLGHDSYCVEFQTKMQTQDNNPIYGLQIGSGLKITQFYVIGRENLKKWKSAFLKAMGLPGIFKQKYVVVRAIGEGSFSKVYLIKERTSEREFAVKMIEKKDMLPRRMSMIRHQIQIQKQCRHPNIAGLVEVLEDQEYTYMVMDYFNLGNLSSLQQKIPKFPPKVALGILEQIAAGLLYLHRKNIIHRDVKRENILLTGYTLTKFNPVTKEKFEVPEVKLADFGLSIFSGNSKQPNQLTGSPVYMAPEMFAEEPYDSAIDVYSLGVLFFKLISDQYPFDRIAYHQAHPAFHSPIPFTDLANFSFPSELIPLSKSKIEITQNSQRLTPPSGYPLKEFYITKASRNSRRQSE